MGGYELFQLLFLVEPELYLVHPSGSKPRQQFSKLRQENSAGNNPCSQMVSN